ncbi:hypothetical protein IMZ29_12715 [Achromobacter sp. GG226]|uniref:hypothetical protein n=1 Tax=Verticiella alkaliphila TaxID=2779529 RepID=UPI001C0AEA1F|nr:hypothetical protein [Verticiella sp. GG226]MBU4611358.1 hypothetical protein [Verticiella sp. GG226]
MSARQRHPLARGVRPQARWALVLALAAAGTGCTVFQSTSRIEADARAAREALAQSHARFASALRDTQARERAQEVDRPWLAGRPEPLAREVTLPAALRANVDTALLFPGLQLDLPTLAERITRATGIAVRVQPEAMLPAERFIGRLAEGSTAATAMVPALPVTVPSPTGLQPLPRLLDHVAARLGVSWRYADGALSFYRVESRVFSVRSLLMQSAASASLGRDGAGGSGAFAAASATRLQADVQDILGAVASRIEPLMSAAGRLAAQGEGTALIVATDTPEALARIADYLDRENRAATRRVRLVFEEVTLTLRDDAEAGIDWNLVYAAARAGGAFAGPLGLAAPAAGSLSGDVTSGRWDGSSAIVRALSQVGVVSRHTSIPLVTLNRRPVTHAVRTTFSWIDQVRTTAMATVDEGGGVGALPSVSVSQKEETVGQFLTLLPAVQEDGQILLSIAYDNTVAQPLTSVSFGRGDNAVQIQQLTVDGTGTVQQVDLRPGQPMIVSGFDRLGEQSDGRRLDAKAPLLLGGLQRTSSQRQTTLVIVTAFPEEGF